VTLAPEKKKLTVNVEYNNGIKMDNTLAYQDMTVTISGGDFSGVKTVKLGKPGDSEVQCVGFAAGENVNVATSGNTYTITVDNELTQNVAYTVTVEGAGYRTARYTVNMAENKVLNFWNNVKDANDFIEVGKDSSKTTKNFLAGDIVKDNQINIYDLSAVVSYFGSAATVDNNYAKYDLNRDGVIDSKDVAYVLVSWGK
ncbi:MAG: dockerin type I domain-containing protein, partial [Monoglobaceae bacterium]